MSQQLDQVRSDAPATNGNGKPSTTLPSFRVTPQLDLYESDNEYLLVIDMPGARAESLEIQVTGRELELRAERAAAPSGTDLASTTFERRVELPGDVDTNSAAAQLKNGVLEVRISKAASARRVKIPISTN
jgi:HSP20 family molecular chaperone IbpA